MQPFTFERASNLAAALEAGKAGARFIAGGTNLFDLMKLNVEHPRHLVDIGVLPLKGIEETSDGGLRIGALTTNTAVANDLRVRSRFPFVSQALLSGASQQLRNTASLAGNLLQRTRCPYFQDIGISACNKREPGSGCAAKHGLYRAAAVIASPADCVATMQSDVAVPLAALDAEVEIATEGRIERMSIHDLYKPAFTSGTQDTALQQGALITAIIIKANPAAERSVYVKVRERASYAFAIVSVAALLDCDDLGNIKNLSVALGSLAPAPWRLPDVEAAAVGKAAVTATFDEIAEQLLASAKPSATNAFRVGITKGIIVRTLTKLAETRS